MKQLFFSTLFTGAMLLSAISYGQHKYTYKPKAVNAVAAKKAYSNTTRVNAASSGNLLSSPVTDPPIINDPIDVYAGNPVLLKASIVVHFGTINTSSANTSQIELLGSPDYFYHSADHIRINSLDYSTIHSNTAYHIPLYANTDNHWTVTYQDFVDKWVDSAHTQLSPHDRINWQGGMVTLYQTGMSGNINKLTLVLQFANGTKTIVWNNPKAFNTYVRFKFNQNFQPMN